MKNRSPKVNGQSLVSFIFEAFMAVLYCVMGYVFLATELFNVNEKVRMPLGILLSLYGLFRLYRVVKKLKTAKDEV